MPWRCCWARWRDRNAALTVGAHVKRVGFGFVLLFPGRWVLAVHGPVALRVWGGGLLASGGASSARRRLPPLARCHRRRNRGSLAASWVLARIAAAVTAFGADIETRTNGLDLSAHDERACDMTS